VFQELTSSASKLQLLNLFSCRVSGAHSRSAALYAHQPTLCFWQSWKIQNNSTCL